MPGDPNANPSDFELTEPQPHDGRTRFVCTLNTRNERLFDYIASLLPVAHVKRQSKESALVAIKDTYDADETWHYLRTELEKESNYVDLDDIWNDALYL